MTSLLTDLLDLPEADCKVKTAKGQILASKPVERIFSKQEADGTWEAPEKYYTAKYRGTVWQLIILAQLGVDGNDHRVRKAMEFVLNASQHLDSGGFSMKTTRNGGSAGSVIPCLTGNVLWAAIRFGYLDDARIKKGIRWVTKYQRFDDSIRRAPVGWPYDQWEICWGRHTCHMGVVKNLKALSEIPTGRRSKAVKDTIDKAVEFILIHHVHKRSHNLSLVSKPGWKKFGYPLMYQTDVLEILEILTRLGCSDQRMGEAVDLLLSKREKNGRWKMENSYNDKFHIKIEQTGKSSKWITLHALRVLKRYLQDGGAT